MANATVRAIEHMSPEIVTLVAMGLEGQTRSDEDEQCALYLRNILQGRTPSKDAVRQLITVGEESQKYDDESKPQWPSQDRTMSLSIDSHEFALKIVKEDGLFVARPEYI